MSKRTNRSAFSLLELVFVIVILGIVSSLGAEIIANVYESYVLQRAQHRASLKTELAATEIANRLRYAIPGTVYRIKNDDSKEEIHTSFIDGDLYKGLQWVAYDGDSFEAISSAADRKPGWSGFCDINTSTTSSISTPGSNLGLANTIIGNLSGGAKGMADTNLYFPYDSTAYDVSAGSGETITLGTNAPRIIEHYKLAWSSYALFVDNNGDLYLYYNFSPSPGVNIVDNNSSRSLLLKNVTNFKFQGAGRTTRFKICKEENIGKDFNITSCKEKAVF